MTPAETIASILPFACLLAAMFRARLAALSLLPPCALIAARALGLVDISSASHPLRWIVPVSCAGLAGPAGWFYALMVRRRKDLRKTNVVRKRDAAIAGFGLQYERGAIAALLILGSCAPDLLALHPFFWSFPEWTLVPLQIAVCATILVVLLTPERWAAKWA